MLARLYDDPAHMDRVVDAPRRVRRDASRRPQPEEEPDSHDRATARRRRRAHADDQLDRPGARPLPTARPRRATQRLERWRRGAAAPPPAAALLGMRLDEVERGRIVFSVVADEMHENPMGTMHGGIIATLVDTAMGCAVFSMLPAGDRLHDARAEDELRAADHADDRCRARRRSRRAPRRRGRDHGSDGPRRARRAVRARDVDLPDQTATGRCVMNYLGVMTRGQTARS